MTGRVNDVAIIENRVGTCMLDDILISNMLAGSGRILIANNTLQNPRYCLRVAGPMIEVRDVQVVNNLILSDAGPDLAYVGADPKVFAGWRIANNYRQHRPIRRNEGSLNKELLAEFWRLEKVAEKMLAGLATR